MSAPKEDRSKKGRLMPECAGRIINIVGQWFVHIPISGHDPLRSLEGTLLIFYTPTSQAFKALYYLTEPFKTKFTAIIATFLAAASCVSAKDKTEHTVDVASAIHAFYPTQTPSIKNAAESTSLAKTLVAVQSSWENSPEWTSVGSAIISAAPTSAQKSIATSGFDYNVLTAANWYTKVDSKARKAYSSEVAALNSAASKVLKNDAVETGCPRMLVAGAVAAAGLIAAL